jgi:hypothetical protein
MIDIKFTNKPISEPIRYNAYYKLVLLLAIIEYCSIGRKASLHLIHLVFWSLRSDENYDVLLNFSNQVRSTLTPWSFEPGVEKILILAFVNKYCEKAIVGGDSLEIKITNEGIEIIKKIKSLDLFKEDLGKIKKLGKIPKNRINNANQNWALL